LRIIEEDLRKGYIKLVPEDQDDLWILYNIIKPGDKVTAQTTRDVKHEEGSGGRRIPMILTIIVKNLEFQPFTERLRIRGIVIEGPERYGVKGHYHTLNIMIGKPLIIWKESWSRYDLELLKRTSSRRKRVLIIAFDYDEAAIALMSEQGVKILEEFSSNIPGKREPGLFQRELKNYMSMIREKIIRYYEKYQPNIIIIASPSNLQKRLSEMIRDQIRTHIIIDHVSMGGTSGVREVLRRDSIREALKEINIIHAQEILNKFHELLVKNPDLVAYGIDDVEECVRYNAVDKLVVSEEYLRTYDEELRRRITSILDEAYKRRAEIVIVPHSSDVGIEVEGLGGIIAILRYPLKRIHDKI
jgi:protein pelota